MLFSFVGFEGKLLSKGICLIVDRLSVKLRHRLIYILKFLKG
jgi:hypothetical protein